MVLILCRYETDILNMFMNSFLGFFGSDVAKPQVMTSCSFVGRSSVLTIGFPVSLEALSIPTRGAGRLYSSITLRFIQSNDKSFRLEREKVLTLWRSKLNDVWLKSVIICKLASIYD